MNTEKLFEFLKTENEVIQKMAYGYSTNLKTEDFKANAQILEAIAKKTHLIESVLNCRLLLPSEIKAAKITAEAKQAALSLFDAKDLIAEFLKEKK